jgi:hypothetical protein
VGQVESRLLDRATPGLLAMAESGLRRFWAEAIPALQARWALVAAAAEVLLTADWLGQALKNAPPTFSDMVHAYTQEEAPWCLLDTRHRQMEMRWLDFEPEPDESSSSLESLVLEARRRFTAVGSELAGRFAGLFAKAKHPIPGLLRQVQVFETQVKPHLGRGRVAYIWVDALRFEMARALCDVLQPDFELTLQPALAAIPTITEIGMAALLPRADQGAKVVYVGGGKLGLEIARTIIKDRKDRIAFLKNDAGVPVCDAKLDDLLPKPTKRVRDDIQRAQLVLVTSQEIDELGEKESPLYSRRYMEGVLNDLRRGIRVLADLEVKTLILAADHGHLFGEEVGEDMKIEAPGGETADLHRRVWVGVGGTSEKSYLRASLRSLGMESDLDIATPWTLACFKVKGGARAYFHGGLSPQELIVPVVVITPSDQAPGGPFGGIHWNLTAGSKKLSTRFFSVQIAGTATGLFGLEPPRVRVEIRSKGKSVSKAVSASYGFDEATGDVHLRASTSDPKAIEPNTVALMITEEVPQKTVGVSLIDANSGTELANLDRIENAISM